MNKLFLSRLQVLYQLQGVYPLIPNIYRNLSKLSVGNGYEYEQTLKFDFSNVKRYFPIAPGTSPSAKSSIND